MNPSQSPLANIGGRLPILNRDWQHPADGWYQIERAGNHPNARAGVVQIIDPAACASIVNRFNAEADQPGFAGMLIDHEHFKHDEKEETRAYGWLMRLQNRADGIYGQIRWTDTGKAAVDGGDYRFFSTEYAPDDLQVVNSKKPRQVRPMRLDGLTLTNVNNNKGQKPITNRTMNSEEMTDEQLADFILNGDYPGHPFHGNQYAEGSSGRSATNIASRKASQASGAAMKSGSAEDHAAAAVAHHRAAAAANKAGKGDLALYHDEMANMHTDAAKSAARGAKNRFPTGLAGAEHQQTQDPVKMKTVIAELKLPADASEPDVLAAVKKITNRASELETATLEADLEAYKDRYPAAQKEFIKSLLVTNRAGTIEYLKAQPGSAPWRKVAPAAIHNRNVAAPVDTGVGGESDAEEVQRIDAINDEVNALRAQNRSLTYEQARNSVRNRKPELFGLPPRGAAR